MDPFVMIMKTMGYMLLILTGIICITFFVWVIKLEFDWFFGLNIFKWFEKKSVQFKVWLAKKLAKIKIGSEKANKKHVILNE